MSLSCNELREDLVAWLDGELPAARSGQVEAHLAACEACSLEAAAHRGVWSALDLLDDDAPASPGWLDRIEAEIREQSRPVRTLAWRWLAVAAALALAVGLALGSGLFGTPQPERVAVRPDQPASPQPSLTPASPTPSTQTTPAADDPYAGLSEEEVAAIQQIDVLVYLDTQEELDVLVSLDLLENLEDDELDGGAG